MARYQVRMILPYRSGLTEDITVNSFAVIGTLGEESGTNLFADMVAFYNETPPATDFAICEYLSPALDRESNRCKMEIYEVPVGGGDLGTPVGVEFWTLGEGPGSPSNLLPNECAICCSFGTVAIEGSTAGSRRGRVFVGPLTATCCEPNVDTNQPQVAESIVDIVSGAGSELQANLASHDWDLAVWSRKHDIFASVNRGWADNEFDTQRRRGRKATFRKSWTIGG